MRIFGLVCGLGLMGAALAAAPCSEAQGQAYIDAGDFRRAVKEFSCVIDGAPTAVGGYRGRIEAELMLGEFSNAARDHARITAVVLPVNPGARQEVLDSYTARLVAAPDSVAALTGASFARWWFFQYPHALQLLGHLLEVAPDNLYGNLLRGSTRLLSHTKVSDGMADLERAILMAPASADVHFIVADAYTYGEPNPTRAFAEANLALNGGLDTPRVRAILATCYLAWGNLPLAAAQFSIHIDQVTTELVKTGPLPAGASMTLALTAGRTFEIPVAAGGGEALSISTSSKDFYDTILVLYAPDGTPVFASDDLNKYFAGVDWTAPAAGTYRLRVTSFESVNTGQLVVARK